MFLAQTILQSKHFLIFCFPKKIDFRFSARKTQNQQKLAKKITHFKIQFRSKKAFILHSSTQLKKLLTLQIFQQSFGWRQKNYLHCIFPRRPRTALSKHL